MGVHGVKAVFFDLDNTLIDTAAAGRRAIEEVLPLSPTALRRGACGHGLPPARRRRAPPAPTRSRRPLRGR